MNTMAVVSDSFEASGVIKINGVVEPDQIPTANDAAAIDKNNNHKEEKKKKKKAGPFGFFRAALVVLRSDKKNKSSRTKKTTATDNDDGNWKKIVGSMRPLHLQDDKSPPPSLPPPSPARNTWDLVYDHSIHSYPPSSPSSSSSVSGGTMSQYASAVNLQALDDGVDEDEDPDVVFDAIRGDEMIDYKAEEFIAQFYERMKMDNHHRQHHKRVKSDPF